MKQEDKEAIKKTYPQFIENLRKSTEAVGFFAGYLEGKGISCSIMKIGDDVPYEQRESHKDGGDILAVIDGVERRIEVKRRSLLFTGRDDFPFDSIMVCAVHAFAHASPKPFCYVTLDRTLRYAAIIPGKTWQSWTEKNVFDRRYGYAQNTYIAGLECVQWRDLKTS